MGNEEDFGIAEWRAKLAEDRARAESHRRTLARLHQLLKNGARANRVPPGLYRIVLPDGTEFVSPSLALAVEDAARAGGIE